MKIFLQISVLVLSGSFVSGAERNWWLDRESIDSPLLANIITPTVKQCIKRAVRETFKGLVLKMVEQDIKIVDSSQFPLPPYLVDQYMISAIVSIVLRNKHLEKNDIWIAFNGDINIMFSMMNLEDSFIHYIRIPNWKLTETCRRDQKKWAEIKRELHERFLKY